jgi:hypothetical protein
VVGVFADTACDDSPYARYLQQGSGGSSEYSTCASAVADKRPGCYCPYLWQLAQGYLVLLGIHWFSEVEKNSYSNIRKNPDKSIFFG